MKKFYSPAARRLQKKILRLRRAGSIWFPQGNLRKRKRKGRESEYEYECEYDFECEFECECECEGELEYGYESNARMRI